MVHTYQLTGMTCSSCVAKVKSALFQVEHVTGVEVSLPEQTVTVTMDKHVALNDLQQVLENRYQITATHHHESTEQVKSWLVTYKPVILIFVYIATITILIEWKSGHFDPMEGMRYFMAGFFLVFSFFKLLNLKGFAESYAMYDVLAKRLPAWAYIYAALEVLLGVTYLIDFQPIVVNAVTLVIMSISIVGVLQTVLNKKSIQCACLGAVFNLPMSTVTIIEDGLMIVMSLVMFFTEVSALSI